MPTEELIKNITSITAGDSELTTLYSYLQDIGCDTQKCYEKLSLISQLKNLMQNDVVEFEFKKINGEQRRAYGTRAEDVLKQNNDVPQNHRKSSTTFPYYDIEKKAWRCFKPELLQSINLNYCL